MTELLDERAAALVALIGKVHPEGIPPAYQITVDGDPDRFAVLPKQANVYRAHQQVQRENERLQ